MCLLALAWRAHPTYRLVVAANRDEFHARPAAPLGIWSDRSDLLGGRDLEAGGTWMALDRRRRFGVITNFRDAEPRRPGAPSRGALIPGFLASDESAADWLAGLKSGAAAHAGFNLLLTDGEHLHYACNRAEAWSRELPAGIYGLSNEYLDTPWPKLTRVKRGFTRWLEDPQPSPEGLYELLADRTDPEGLPPGTGPDAERERALARCFVLHPTFGTRCSSVLLLAQDGSAWFGERRFDSAGHCIGSTGLRIGPGEWPAPGTAAGQAAAAAAKL